MAAKHSTQAKLSYVMEQSGTTPRKVAGVMGTSQPLVSHILSGKRNLTTAHLRKLGMHFKIAPG
jgi:antitoxin component HigA of HigAB toxin-antitoxin module